MESRNREGGTKARLFEWLAPGTIEARRTSRQSMSTADCAAVGLPHAAWAWRGRGLPAASPNGRPRACAEGRVPAIPTPPPTDSNETPDDCKRDVTARGLCLPLGSEGRSRPGWRLLHRWRGEEARKKGEWLNCEHSATQGSAMATRHLRRVLSSAKPASNRRPVPGT
jgi:hypothetical protein